MLLFSVGPWLMVNVEGSEAMSSRRRNRRIQHGAAGGEGPWAVADPGAARLVQSMAEAAGATYGSTTPWDGSGQT